MNTRVQKWGNSLALRIPKSFADSVGLAEGSGVRLELEDGKLVISKLPTYFSGDEYGVSVERDKVEEWKAATWQLVPSLDMPELDPPAIQWALLDEDPLPGFRKQVEKRKALYEDRVDGSLEGSSAELVQLSLSQAVWNFAFRPKTGDEVYLLAAAIGRLSGFSSNATKKTVWLVTKPVQVHDRVLAWSVRLEPKIGVQDKVSLNAENSIDLTSIVGEIIS